MRDKKAIKRFIQLTFITWTLILLIKLENEPDQEMVKNKTIGEVWIKLERQIYRFDERSYGLFQSSLP
ncbi:MAG: hypothetical protein K8R53_12290 [Bacteroidales bacterium]|nr:hypothetical protein [Bacteroidales bacterium]